MRRDLFYEKDESSVIFDAGVMPDFWCNGLLDSTGTQVVSYSYTVGQTDVHERYVREERWKQESVPASGVPAGI